MATEILGLEELAPGQASKETSHNTALREIEGRTIRALDKDLTVAPSSPANGDTYIVASGATGTWLGHDNKIAHFFGGSWKYWTPIEGLTIAVVDEQKTYSYYDSAWELSGGVGAALTDGDKGDITVSASGATWAIDASVISPFGRTLTDDADATTARTTLGLVIGTHVQAYDPDLAALAGLTSAADKGIQFTGAGAAATYDLTVAGKALLDDADAAAQRTTLGLGTAALLASDTDVALAANSDLVLATQKAVKGYVDGIITGGANDLMIFKGAIDCSGNPNYPAADAGHFYKVSVAGLIGGGSGYAVQAGDSLYCITDGTAAGAQASVGASWNVASSDVTVATHGALINGATAKAEPVDADFMGIMDSAASNVLKKLSWVNIKAALKTYFDTLYATASQPFDVHAFYPGVPAASSKVMRIPVARAVTFPDEFAGSHGNAGTAATASTAFDVQKNGVSVGTITFAIAATTATFVTSGTTVVLASGDILSIIAPATPDATLADVGFALAGTR